MDSNEASDIYLSFKESLENLQQMNFEDILHINLFKNMHIITEQVLNSLAISLELDDIEQFQKIIHYFFGIMVVVPLLGPRLTPLVWTRKDCIFLCSTVRPACTILCTYGMVPPPLWVQVTLLMPLTGAYGAVAPSKIFRCEPPGELI